MVEYIQLQFSQRLGETWVRIDEGPLGQSEGLFHQPFTALQAAARLEAAGVGSEFRLVLADLGKELVAALNQAGAGEALRVAVDQARAAQSTVLLQIRFDEGAVALAALPWELLHDGRRHLLAAGAVDMTRYITYGESTTSLSVQAPLQVLHLGASPKDLPALDIELSVSALKAIPGLVLSRLTPPTYDALLERLEAEPKPHIVHFDGHGLVEGGTSSICLQTAEGRCDPVDADALQNVLYGRIALVVLNACQTSAVDASMSTVFGAMAPMLIQAGIPAVVGMQFPIADRSAIRFTEAFYGAIARGETLTRAMAAARRWLYREGTWHIPTLYLRSTDQEGVLLPKKKAQILAVNMDNLSLEIKALREELAIHRENLRFLRQQTAAYGAGAVPLHLINQIHHEEQAIEKIEGELAQKEG